jgi:hypothetical protein
MTGQRGHRNTTCTQRPSTHCPSCTVLMFCCTQRILNAASSLLVRSTQTATSLLRMRSTIPSTGPREAASRCSRVGAWLGYVVLVGVEHVSSSGRKTRRVSVVECAVSNSPVREGLVIWAAFRQHTPQGVTFPFCLQERRNNKMKNQNRVLNMEHVSSNHK